MATRRRTRRRRARLPPSFLRFLLISSSHPPPSSPPPPQPGYETTELVHEGVKQMLVSEDADLLYIIELEKIAHNRNDREMNALMADCGHGPAAKSGLLVRIDRPITADDRVYKLWVGFRKGEIFKVATKKVRRMELEAGKRSPLPIWNYFARFGFMSWPTTSGRSLPHWHNLHTSVLYSGTTKMTARASARTRATSWRRIN